MPVPLPPDPAARPSWGRTVVRAYAVLAGAWVVSGLARGEAAGVLAALPTAVLAAWLVWFTGRVDARTEGEVTPAGPPRG